MLRNKGKGQGLVEFALILPILLMLLLGIIEGGRIIWAFVTVQNAAREAARYAVTGRPFACGGDPAGSPDFTVYCDDAERGDPWTPQVVTTTRVAAIKEIAREVGQNLAVRVWADTDIPTFNLHRSTPGAFGIAVIGQTSAGNVISNFGGEPGRNVRVETYYNVEMIDPIFNVIMGGQTIHLSGQVELQNEGVDASVDGYVGGITYDTDSCAPNCGGGGQVAFITVWDDVNEDEGNLPFVEKAGGNFRVAVNDHLPNTAYRLYFTNGVDHEDYVEFTTDNLGGKLINFVISVAAPKTNPLPPTGSPNYRIYTTLAGDPNTPIATCLGDTDNSPCFSVDQAESNINARNIDGFVEYGGQNFEQKVNVSGRWPISSSIPIYLGGHNPDQDYTINFNGQPSSSAPGTLLWQGGNSNVIRTGSDGANLNGDPAYYIATGYGPNDTVTINSVGTTASTDIQIIEANLDIQGETDTSTHPRDDVVTIILRGHAPQQQYQVFYNDGISSPSEVRVNDNGELAVRYQVLRSTHTPQSIPDGVNPADYARDHAIPVEIYTRDYGRGPNSHDIARQTIWLFTNANPYINVPGGATWPAGSPIRIQLRRHDANTDYVVSIQQGEADSPSFNEQIAAIRTETDPDGLGIFDLNYEIPFSFAGRYNIRSFLPDDLDNPVAEYEILVTGNPYITIDGGKRWPPGADIVIRLLGHAGNTPYDIWLDKGGPEEALLGTVFVNSQGEGTLNYRIPQDMPSMIEPGYDLHSYLGNSLTADNGELEVYPADLVVSRIQLPGPVRIDQENRIILTIRNNNPVSITNTYFDTDIYIDPDPVPNALNSGLPPGDYKNWLSGIPAESSVTVEDSIVLFGEQSHEIHARVDTTRNVAETNEGNNIRIEQVQGICPVEIIDEFDDGAIGPEWTPGDFGDSAGTSSQTESDGTLLLSNAGSDALTADDDGAGAGYHRFHRSIGGGIFEVYVRLDQTALNGNDGRAGLEVRADASSTADKLMLVYRSNGWLQVLTRQSGFVDSPATQSLGSITPVWLRISRNGDEFTFAYAPNASGDNPPAVDGWTEFETVSNFGLPDSVEVGLVNAPASGTDVYEARFKYFHVCGSSGASRCGQVEENGNGLVVLDAVNTVLIQSGSGHSWTADSMAEVLGEPSLAGLAVRPDDGDDMAAGTGPHAVYQVNFESGGTYYAWAAAWGPDTAGDSFYLRLNDNAATTWTIEGTDARGVAFPVDPSPPGWVKLPGSLTIDPGVNTVDLWAKEDGVMVFKILLTQDPNFVPPDDGMVQSACTLVTEPHIPPGLRVCTYPLQYGDFEGTLPQVDATFGGVWRESNGTNIRNSFVVHDGDYAAAYPANNRFPKISQGFDLPGWILTDTVASLSLWSKAEGSSSPNDQLEFTLRWASEPQPPAAGFDLITPILLTDGSAERGDDWAPFSNQNIFAGLNPQSVLEPGAAVRAYFYTPNAVASTEFYLDDINFSICTTQALPEQDPDLGKISGFTRRSGQFQPGVAVWAYAYSEDGSTPGPVFKTYSIQDGSFSFYNLPPGQYLIYATLTDENGTFFATSRVPVGPVGAGGQGEINNILLNVITG